MRTVMLAGALAIGGALVPPALAAQTTPPPLSVRAQFRLTLGLTSLSWANAAVARAAGPEIAVERWAFGPIAIRFGAATVSAIERATATRHYLLDATLLVAPRLQVANREVVPQAGIGIGTTVSNPAVDSLTTHSQNTWGWLVGVDAQLVGPISLGVQLRRLSVRLQDVTSTAPSTPGVSTGVTAIVGRVGVRF